MTREEYVAICQKCELRKMDAQKGLVCSLTEEQADFTDTCANYKEDAEEVHCLQQKEQEYQASLKVSGWLAFFLWVGVGLGALISAHAALPTLFNTGLPIVFRLLYLGNIVCLIAIAVMTICAFYTHKNNAVSLALTYVAMIALDGVFALVIEAMIGDDIAIMSIVRQFLWAGIWCTYILSSSRVANLIPKEQRTWNKLEKLVLGLYVAIQIFIVIMVGWPDTFII